MKRFFFFSTVIAMLLFLLCYPKEAFQASADGLRLWFFTVLPTLLPFLILSDALIHAGKIPAVFHRFSRFFSWSLGLSLYGTYAFTLGLFCGYPMGARLTADLLKEKKIDRREADYLLTFANNASPMFISSYILLQTLNMQQMAVATFTILYLSTFLTSLFFRCMFHRFPGKSTATSDDPIQEPAQPLPERLIDYSIMNGFETITRLGGYIILFSIAAAMVHTFFHSLPVISWLLPGIMEITTGIHLIGLSAMPVMQKYVIILTLTTFGGISSVAQTKGMLNGTPLSIKTYILGKTVQTAFTLSICILFFHFQTIQ
ncbi:MAG: sporulation protein [Oliverpabstia sp.]